MLSITAALICTASLGLLFASTRKLGILAVALLCFLFPVPVLSLLLVGGCILYFFSSVPTFAHQDVVS
jgi:hypothetical protein